jgi:chlorobactene glucosyltransferase
MILQIIVLFGIFIIAGPGLSRVRIIVLDDNLTDNTAAIVSHMQEKDTRIQLIHGKPLPDGWAGKPFACQQLARQATGSWLLFSDAVNVFFT